MDVEWNAIATITAPVIALFFGVWVNRRFGSRPVLISYYGHISSIRTTPPNGNPIHVHTHAVVLRNVGRQPATNVRLHHHTLPDFSIRPSINCQTEDLLDGTRDIIIPKLVPGEEVTVSYLYFPPLTAADINAGIKSDQGFARQIPVLLQRQYPGWFNRTMQAFLIVGVIAVLYLVYVAVGAVIG
jgi:hypothetical protein